MPPCRACPDSEPRGTHAEITSEITSEITFGAEIKLRLPAVLAPIRPTLLALVALRQVNNFFIFPGMSFGAVQCDVQTIPERLFMASAEAVARSLSDDEIAKDRVVPHPDRIRDVSLNVAIATVLEAQRMGIANLTLGATEAEVRAKLEELMWVPGCL